MTSNAAGQEREAPAGTPSGPASARFAGWFRDRWRTGPSWTCAAAGCALVALALWGWRAVEQVLPGAAGASWSILAIDLGVAAGVVVVVTLLLTAVAALIRRRIPAPFAGTLVGCLVLLTTMGAGASLVGWMSIVVVTVVTAATAGAFAGGVLGGRRPGAARARPSRSRTAVTGVVVLVGVALAGWLIWPGPGAPDIPTAGAGAGPPDPTARGPHDVVVTTYGGGGDGMLARYGSEADVPTEPVDASGVIEGWTAGDTRSEVWGFDPGALPLNATVWAPADGDDHPLVLIAHGNSPFDDSELGFAYLGELLASRGYVVAAVDQSFLDTGVLDRAGEITGADRARAWLLLHHLRQWGEWARAGDGPVPGRVDVDHVTLAGHSRGGEAASVATALHGDEGAGGVVTDATITGVVAIAPSDGLDQVDGAPTELTGVSYLTLAGSHDADVGSFAGAEQYARTSIEDGQIKAAVTVYRANHSQFNSRWGRYDVGLGVVKHVIDTAALLTPEEQRQAAAVFVSAFLDRTVRDDQASGALFTGYPPDVDYLPDTAYRIAVATGDQSRVETFTGATAEGEEVMTRLGPVTVEGGTATVATVPRRVGQAADSALSVAGDGSGGEIVLRLAIDGAEPAAGDMFTVDLADATPSGQEREPVVVTLRAQDGDGMDAVCELTGPSGLPGQLPGRTLKLALLQPSATSEPTLQTFTVPEDCLTGAGLDWDEVEELMLVLQDTGDGVLVDDLGLVPATG